jgi:predicted naringenin-chalcone synthase
MLIDISTSSPPYNVTQIKAAEGLKKRMGESPAISRIIDTVSYYSGIENRCVIIPDAEIEIEDKFYSKDGIFIRPGTKERMLEYEKWSAILAKEAVRKLIEQTNIDPQSINKIVTISCTGFFAPGLDYVIIKEFKIPASVKRTNIGFMGCAASLIGFDSVWNTMNSIHNSETNSLLISVELCSIHLQAEPTRDNILANMIFADGCAAALFSNSRKYEKKIKLNPCFSSSILFDNSSKYMGWKVGNYGFEMILSSDLPGIILKEAVPKLKKILISNGLTSDKINYWALHPGGRAILDALQEGLEISDEKMVPSRNVLKNFGNMSSASILFVLKEIINSGELKKDENVCAVAFGPGLTMEVVLLKGA